MKIAGRRPAITFDLVYAFKARSNIEDGETFKVLQTS
jgi:hypothetical protein